MDSTLNVCAEDSRSCISTYNEDQDHFVAPWMYVSFDRAVDVRIGVEEDATDKAISELIKVATTGSYRKEAGLASQVIALEAPNPGGGICTWGCRWEGFLW